MSFWVVMCSHHSNNTFLNSLITCVDCFAGQGKFENGTHWLVFLVALKTCKAILFFYTSGL